MIANVHTGTLLGVQACGVRVEASPVRGLPGFDIVGLPETAVRESRVRVLAAVHNSGFALPERRFAINLAPADLRKAGAALDLAIAVALLTASGLCPSQRLNETLLLGELSLDGRLLHTRGVLPQLRSAQQRGLRQAIISPDDQRSGALLTSLQVRTAAHLGQVIRYLTGQGNLPLASTPATLHSPPADPLDLSDVQGQECAKRALEIACIGRHNILLIGPPGTGKTMLAQRLPGLLPPPSPLERMEIATIASAAELPELHPHSRPFRSPHHSCSQTALVGGGSPLRPGEVTLAHGGVLFLDELPEFRRSVLEALRPTMESGEVHIVRAQQRITMPAAPLVVGALNPCPCGYAGDPQHVCRCTPLQLARYRNRISGPLLDRFDMHLQLGRIPVAALRQQAHGDRSPTVRKRVAQACAFAAKTGPAPLAADALTLLQLTIERLGLSLRAYHKTLRIARSIAQLAQAQQVTRAHVAEAIQYRVLDRSAGPQAIE